MKRIFKTLAIVAVAATALVACQNEIDNNQQVNTGKTGVSSFKFYAQTGDVATKATLEPNDDETAFAAAWEGSDGMVLVTKGYQGETLQFDETGTASWSEEDGAFESFYEEDTPEEAYSTWVYDAFYPWYDESQPLQFGSQRTQVGNNFNSTYDLMYGHLETSNSIIGQKDATGAPIVIDMNRLTAIAYYHIEAPNAPNEKVVSATLTVDEDKVIAADYVAISADGTQISTVDADNNETGTNSITITFDEDSAPNASDFTLWFNLLTETIGEASSYNVTVDIETENHTARLTSKSARSFTAGKLNRAHITSNLTWTDKPLFYESFDKCESTGGNDNSWSGQIATGTFSDDVADNDGWVLAHGNAANAAIKLGAGSTKGSATTPAFNVSSDLATLTFKAAAWNGGSENTGLTVSIAEGTGVLSESSVTLTKGAWTEYTIYIAGAGEGTKIKFEANQASNNRFFLDEVKVVPGGTAFDYLSVSTEGEELDADVTEASFTISTNAAWTASVAEETAELDETSGTGNATLTVTFPANNSASVVTAATVTVTVGSGEDAIVKTVTYTQKADENYVASKTIAEFIELADTENNYRLTGNVTSAIQIGSSYNRFTITDATGSILVYNLDDVSQFVEGDIVTIHGKYAVYNNAPEVVEGVYETHVTTPKLSASVTSISASDSDTQKTYNVVADENVAWTVASDNSDLSFSPASGTGNAEITVSFSANTVSTEKTATITVSSETENVYKEREILFVQSGKVSGKPTTVTYDATAQGYENNTTVSSWSSTPLSINFDKGTGSNDVKYYTTGTAVRVYPNGYFTVSTSVGAIVEISLTFGSGDNTNEITSNVGSYENGAWSGSASSVTFTVGGSSGHRRIKTISITYLDPNGTVENPTLTVDNDFSLVVGQTKPLTVNTNSDGEVTYQSSNTSVAEVDENGVVTAKAVGSATITVNVAAAEWYNAASETVDVTVIAKAVQTVTVAGLKASYATGDDFDATCTVTANYNDNTSETVAATDYTMTVTKDNVAVTNLTNLAAGTYYATVAYSGVSSDPIEITVSDNGGGDPTSVDVTISSYAFTNNWENSTQYSSITIDDYITATASTASNGTNTGKYYSTDNTWRFYANESAKLTIAAASGYTIKTVTLTYTIKDSGTISYGNTSVTSANAVTVNDSSAEFTISQSSGNKGKIFITKIEVTYE